jgi:hypothetical protein
LKRERHAGLAQKTLSTEPPRGPSTNLGSHVAQAIMSRAELFDGMFELINHFRSEIGDVTLEFASDGFKVLFTMCFATCVSISPTSLSVVSFAAIMRQV